MKGKSLMFRFEISGKLDGLNEYISAERSNRYTAAKLKHKNQAWVCLCIKNQLRAKRINGAVYIYYHFYEPNAKRDWDNVSGYAHKVIQDALVECGVIKDDSQRYVVGFSDTFSIDRKNPRIEVEIEEI